MVTTLGPFVSLGLVRRKLLLCADSWGTMDMVSTACKQSVLLLEMFNIPIGMSTFLEICLFYCTIAVLILYIAVCD